MAKDTYKKRMKGHWQQGKGCKGDSEERQYAKREIAQALAADEEGYLERHHKGARTKNERARTGGGVRARPRRGELDARAR